MKGSMIVLLFFMAGCILGVLDIIPLDLQKSNLSMYILYALMLQVGLSIGSSKDLKSIVKDIRPKYLLIPLATIIGTLLFFRHLPVCFFRNGAFSTVWLWVADLPIIHCHQY